MTKRFLMILVMVSWCNASFAEEFITFKNCYANEEYNSMEESGRDELSFDINTIKRTVVRTMIWNDETLALEKFKYLNLQKINQEEYKIAAIGKRYISTTFPQGVLPAKFIFDLEKYEIQVSIKSKSDIDTFTLICEK